MIERDLYVICRHFHLLTGKIQESISFISRIFHILKEKRYIKIPFLIQKSKNQHRCAHIFVWFEEIIVLKSIISDTLYVRLVSFLYFCKVWVNQKGNCRVWNKRMNVNKSSIHNFVLFSFSIKKNTFIWIKFYSELGG